MVRDLSAFFLFSRALRPLAPALPSGLLVLALAACSSKEAPDESVNEEEVVPASEEEAREVEARFDGVFAHQVEVRGETLETRLELTEEGIRQTKSGLVVYEGNCTRTALTRRRVTFECRDADDVVTRWPMEIDAEGRLFHRAQPELRFERVAREE